MSLSAATDSTRFPFGTAGVYPRREDERGEMDTSRVLGVDLHKATTIFESLTNRAVSDLGLTLVSEVYALQSILEWTRRFKVYEYFVVKLDWPESDDGTSVAQIQLNSYARDGWRLRDVIGRLAIMEREITQGAAK